MVSKALHVVVSVSENGKKEAAPIPLILLQLFYLVQLVSLDICQVIQVLPGREQQEESFLREGHQK